VRAGICDISKDISYINKMFIRDILFAWMGLVLMFRRADYLRCLLCENGRWTLA